MKFFLLILCIIFFYSSTEILTINYGWLPRWYAGYVCFADWRHIQMCDFATNVAVYNWYTGGITGSYRPNDLDEFYRHIRNKEVLIIGIDYYALNISRSIVPGEILSTYGKYLENGGVLVLEAKGENGKIKFRVLR